MAIISIIAAIGKNRELGKDNDLLWHIPGDLKRFKNITAGHTVIMGRKTFNSINDKPLPKRKNIIITSQTGFNGNGALVVSSLDEAMAHVDDNEEVFILGGSSIYEQFLPRTNKMYLTHVHQSYDADVYFPEYDKSDWKETYREDIVNDPRANVDYSFVDYTRK